MIPNHLRTTGFSIYQATGGLMMILGAVLSVVVTALWSVSAVWIWSAGVVSLLLVYTVLCIRESLPATRLHPVDLSNPLAPLSFVNANPLIFWISLVASLGSAAGASFGVVLVFINDQMDVHDQNESNLLNMALFTTVGVSCMVFASLVLPALQHCGADNIWIGALGIASGALSQLIWSLIARSGSANYALSIALVVSGAVFFGGGILAYPALRSLITNNIVETEHGLAMGVVSAYGSIARIWAPFGFGYLYNATKALGAPATMFYIIALLLALCGLIVALPLRRFVAAIEGESALFYVSRKGSFSRARRGSVSANLDDLPPDGLGLGLDLAIGLPDPGQA